MAKRPRSEDGPAPGCHGCRHFRVTYDVAWPYACDRFEMRSKRLPSVEVEQASGEPCQAREERAPSRPPRRSGGGLYA